MLNNPIRLNDPTGHVCEDPEKIGGVCFGSGTTRVGDRMIRGNGAELGKAKNLPKKDKEKKDKDLSLLLGLHPNSCTVNGSCNPPAVLQSLPSFFDNYCGDISWLACGAMLAQDAATLIDLVGVGLIETPAVALGCLDGGPLGCVIAEIGVITTWNLTLNNAEWIASTASLGFTVADDIFNNGGWGESSSTSLATWAAGSLPLTPSWDLVVDGYSSGYNHGIFNSVHTIWTDGLLK